MIPSRFSGARRLFLASVSALLASAALMPSASACGDQTVDGMTGPNVPRSYSNAAHSPAAPRYSSRLSAAQQSELRQGGQSTAASEDRLRPAIAKHLVAAQKHMDAGQLREALAQIEKAEARSGLRDYERYVIASQRAAVLGGLGDALGAARAYETVIASERLVPEQRRPITQAMAVAYFRAKDFTRAVTALRRYRADGGADVQTLAMLSMALYLSGDYAAAAQESGALIARLEAAGKKPSPDLLKVSMNSHAQRKDSAAYQRARQELLRHYPGEAT